MNIDDPVLVWDSPAFGKHKMHFAGFNSDGDIETWRNGTTSWTNNSKKSWKYYEEITKSSLAFLEDIQ